MSLVIFALLASTAAVPVDVRHKKYVLDREGTVHEDECFPINYLLKTDPYIRRHVNDYGSAQNPWCPDSHLYDRLPPEMFGDSPVYHGSPPVAGYHIEYGDRNVSDPAVGAGQKGEGKHNGTGEGKVIWEKGEKKDNKTHQGRDGHGKETHQGRDEHGKGTHHGREVYGKETEHGREVYGKETVHGREGYGKEKVHGRDQYGKETVRAKDTSYGPDEYPKETNNDEAKNEAKNAQALPQVGLKDYLVVNPEAMLHFCQDNLDTLRKVEAARRNHVVS